MKISGIYSIIHLASGRAYFGSSARALSRMKEHRRLLCNGNHPNIHLQRAWNLYGAKAFRFAVEEIVKDVTQLLIREQAWIDAAQSLEPGGFNLCPVAGSTLGIKYTEESKQKLRDAWNVRKQDPDWQPSFKGRKHSKQSKNKVSIGKSNPSEKTRAKMRASSKKRWARRDISDETRAKQSVAQKGKTLTKRHRAKIAASAKRHWELTGPMPQETRAKQVLAHTGKQHTLKSRRKMSRDRKGKPWSKARRAADPVGRKNSPETIARMRIAAQARWARVHCVSV